MPKVSKMTIVHEVMRQVPNENTKKGVSTIHECGLCGTVDALCEYVSCFMFCVFAFTCHIDILKVTERSLHALPRNLCWEQNALLWVPFERFLLDFCSFCVCYIILGNEKSLCYKYRTSIFRYVKYAYEPYSTVLPYCYITGHEGQTIKFAQPNNEQSH